MLYLCGSSTLSRIRFFLVLDNKIYCLFFDGRASASVSTYVTMFGSHPVKLYTLCNGQRIQYIV